MSSASAAQARHDECHCQTRSTDAPSLAQRSILEGMKERIEAYGECPSDLSGRQALEAILKSDDLYVL